VLDIRRGDEFSVLFEEQYVDGEFIGYGRILAAEFVNQSTRYRAVYYQDTSGRDDYFSSSGESMRKAFLRAPVEFSRISSNFNMRRLHPIQKRVMPHRGIDYVAPSGTPTCGRRGSRSRGLSNRAQQQHVIVHMVERFEPSTTSVSSARIKSGTGCNRVRSSATSVQLMGNGSHLHYEFLVNGVHKNPRTVPLPRPSRPSTRARPI
jgi:murein DD-endopeptidase MepM/ murein hydrolase activator NlpD